MKRTEHRTSFFDVLSYLESMGPLSAEDIGEHFWPDKVGFGPSRGGPSSIAVSASYLLGKLRARGLVSDAYEDRFGSRKLWHITNSGREWLLSKARSPQC